MIEGQPLVDKTWVRMQVSTHATKATMPETAFQSGQALSFMHPSLCLPLSSPGAANHGITAASLSPPLALRTPPQMPLASAQLGTAGTPSSGERSDHTQQLLQQLSPASAPSAFLQASDIAKAFSGTAQLSAREVSALEGAAHAASAATTPPPTAPAEELPRQRWQERLCHTSFFGQCPRHKSNKYRRCEVRA
jgi:hypothetical protein